MSLSIKTKKMSFEEAGKILDQVKLLTMPIFLKVEPSTLKGAFSGCIYEQFIHSKNGAGIGVLGEENIKALLSGLDPHILSERGLFVYLEITPDLSNIHQTSKMRIVGLLCNGQWLVIDIFPDKIFLYPEKGIRLRDCFKIIRIGENPLGARDCHDILFVPEDSIELVFHFHLEIHNLWLDVTGNASLLEGIGSELIRLF